MSAVAPPAPAQGDDSAAVAVEARPRREGTRILTALIAAASGIAAVTTAVVGLIVLSR